MYFVISVSKFFYFMKGNFILALIFVGVGNTYGQQFASLNTTNKPSGEVLSIAPTRKIERILLNKREEEIIPETKPDNEVKPSVFDVSYTITQNKNYKYNTHIEGRIKDCKTSLPIPHAYVSLHNAVQYGNFILVAANTEGYFSVDVTDDYVGGITLIKKGYTEREFNLVNVNEIDTKKLYPITNTCLTATF